MIINKPPKLREIAKVFFLRVALSLPIMAFVILSIVQYGLSVLFESLGAVSEKHCKRLCDIAKISY